MTDLIVITRQELEMLREKKSIEITYDDIETLLENKDLFIRWLSSEMLLYKVKLGNLEVGETESKAAILCLKNTIERLDKIDEVVEKYNKLRASKDTWLKSD